MTRYERLLRLRDRMVELGYQVPTDRRLLAVDRAIATARPWGAWSPHRLVSA